MEIQATTQNATRAAYPDFAGEYHLSEYQGEGASRKLLSLETTIRVTQTENSIELACRNENDGSTWNLNYPILGGPFFDAENQVFKYTRYRGEKVIADIMNLPEKVAQRGVTSYRLWWVKDESGRILETLEEFDANGKRTDSRQGIFRVLTPVARA